MTLLAVLGWWALPAHAAEFRFGFGGHIDSAPAGILDLGLREGPLTVQLLTDTVDVRVTSVDSRGRVTLGLRAATFAAEMWHQPWTDGVPDPTQAQTASYFGPDAEVQRYLPLGFWLGASGWVRPHWFRPRSDATSRVVADTMWTRAELEAGLWRDDGRLQGRVAVGVDHTATGGAAPHATLTASAHLDGALTPTLGLRAGWADARDDITATRLGGLTPYGVPLAGAGWAEFWVEDYGVARGGLRATAGPFTVHAAVDVAAWTLPLDAGNGSAFGVEGRTRWQDRAVYVEAAVGVSPSLAQAGRWPVPVYLLVGSDWVVPGT